MSFTQSDNMIMPVAPMNNYGAGNAGFDGGFGNNGAWWLLVLLFALGGFGNNGWGNNAGNGVVPYMLNNNTNNDVQRGFDQQAVMNGINTLNSNVSNGFSNVQQSLCNGFAGVNSTVSNGFANAEVANNARQIANMQQDFASQTAITGGISGLSSQLAQCCCENRLATANLNSTILAENCADRTAVAEGVRDILSQQTNNTNTLLTTINGGIQSIKDQLCQQEIDKLKSDNLFLQNQITAQNIRAEGLANRAAILADNASQTQALEQYLNPTAIPAYIVQNPNGCRCNNYNNYGYGC